MRKRQIGLINNFILFGIIFLGMNPNIYSSMINTKEFDKFLENYGVEEKYSPTSFSSVLDFLAEYSEELKTLPSNEENDDLKEERLPYIEYLTSRINLSIQLDVFEQEVEYNLVRRIIFTMIAEDFEYGFVPLKWIVKDLPRQFRNSLPYLYPDEIDQPIGKKQAELEAKNLYYKTESRFYRPDELASMSVKEISELDIRDDHFFWKNFSDPTKTEDPWDDLEKKYEAYLTKKLKNKHSDLGEGFQYRISEARRIHFYSGLKINDTNPKINTKDRFGVKWKMKWGAENQSEPVANDLYLNAGGKINDLVYLNNLGKEDFVLIFDKKTKKEDGLPRCETVTSVKSFIFCLRKGFFKFNVVPYISESGVIDEKNVKKVLGVEGNYQSTLEGADLKSLLGREFIIFNEVMVEIRNGPYELKGGAISFGEMDSENDRAMRSLALFNYWIHNIDNRDPNGRGIVVQDEQMGPIYLETQHDLGASMGSLMYPAHINKIKTGEKFLKVNGDKLVFKEMVIFLPESWRKATFSDVLWMGRHLAKIDEGKLKRAIARTNWPDFMQRAYFNKLRSRQLRILGFLGLVSEKEQWKIEDFDFELDLSTPTMRREVTQKYNLPSSALENEMKELGLLNNKGEGHFVDTVVRNGKIRKCDDSVLVSLLEKHKHPSGLSRRVFRFMDHRAPKDCHFDD